ncbi:MAG: energy transducer TonB [Gemmatimonadetes bacterium]|nr:TonB family protein [Gemmatimonadota bacterium]NNF13715.1 energy transducer TonB [Gemmatimonadota bacterium]NNL31489.1 energy transducer TonB [Gemmatimonadota bacterium]
MAAAKAVPLNQDLDSRYQRLKDRFSSILWGSMILATIVHFAAFAYWPEIQAEDFSFTADELTAVELPPEIEVPPPPKAIARPATPVIASTEVSEEITIAPTTFEENPVSALPPPPEVTEKERDLSERPTFTPFTVAPDILNRDEIIEAMIRAYPPILRDAGIGGVTKVYFFIDDKGVVQDTRVSESSGHQALDEAALEVAGLYRFSPALNRDTRVPVWVSFPVEFRVARR